MAPPEITLEQAQMIRRATLMHEGWLVGLRHALGVVLEVHGLVLSAEQKQVVEASDDAFEIRGWIRRAVTVSSTDDLFDESD